MKSPVLLTNPPFGKLVPGAPGGSLLTAGIGGAMAQTDAYRKLVEQNARLRRGSLSGLDAALAVAPPKGNAGPGLTAPQRPPHDLYELGLTLEAMCNTEGAIQALQQAVAQRPGMSVAWRRLGDMLLSKGDREAAAAAHEAATRSALDDPEADWPVRVLPPAVLRRGEREVSDMLASELPSASGGLLRRRMEANPTDAPAILMLANIGLGRGLFLEAAKLLQRALELAPNYHAARQAFVVTLQARGRWAEAIRHTEMLLAHDARNPDYLTAYAELLAQMGDYEKSIGVFDRAAKMGTRPARFWVSYGHALKNAGRRDDGVKAYRKALDIQPSLGEAWWGLANMKNVRFSAADQAAINEHLASPALSDDQKVQLNYALGRALELDGDYASSFRHYQMGGKIRHGQFDYAPERWGNWTKQVVRTKAVFSQALFDAHAGAGCPDPAPIFILGLPRVGSTLLEQILASHSAVEGTNELMEMGTVLDEVIARHGPYPECAALLDAAELAEMGARYIELTRPYRKTDRPFFIDKLPGNWPRSGLIHLILPNAKIIDARREARSSCFSVFKQLFGFGSEYSYDLTTLADYYNDYISLMGHFDSVLPGRIHRVLYENMVEDTEAEIRRLLSYCGLLFEPACLRFWETKRAVATPSSEQVRQPIFKDGMDQWRNYEPFLGPLKARLDLDAATAASVRVAAPRAAFSLPFDGEQTDDDQ